MDEGDIVVGQVLHLLVNPVRFRFDRGRMVQGSAQLPLRQSVCDGALLGSFRRGVGLTRFEDGTRWAVQPPVCPEALSSA